jgi:glycosyltransferase involved in cell wall biosynthesis
VLAHQCALVVAGWIGPRRLRPVDPRGLHLLLTGTIHSDNWIRAHVAPLAVARGCRLVTMVTTTRFQESERVRAVYPPRWLVSCVGSVAARCLVFFRLAWREKPDVVGGFHLLINGLATLVAARAIGVRSLYFCVAGADEAADGGCRAENPIFGRMETPDRFVESRLLRAAAAFDLIVTMGTTAAEYFRRRGLRGECHVIAGAVDASEYQPAPGPPSSDVVVVGRLAPIKRLDVLLEAMALVARLLPQATATLVGDGPLRPELEATARRLGVDGRVRFAGFHADVRPWLAQGRLYVMSSDSEGLPQALTQAMMTGLPAVVTDVGDVRDLVEDGVNGFRVPRRDPAALAERIVAILADEPLRAGMGRRARDAAMRYETARVVRLWEEILARFAPATDAR